MLRIALVILSGAASAATLQYNITDLGAGFSPTAINSVGQIVGGTLVWSGGTVTDIPISGRGINDSGAIVGTTPSGHAAVYYAGGGLTDFGLSADGDPTSGTAINNGGQAVGFWQSSGGARGAFLYPTAYPGGITLSVPLAINTAGQVVGLTLNPSAYVFSNGTVTDLGSLPGATGNITVDINDQGFVIGRATFGANPERPVFWGSGGPVALGTTGGCYVDQAFALNNLDQIVGRSVCFADSLEHAILWLNGQPTDLNSLVTNGANWILIDANNINDSGQIVGVGTLNGQAHGFLLTPLAAEASPTPEPPTAVFPFIAFALGALAKRNTRNSNQRASYRPMCAPQNCG